MTPAAIYPAAHMKDRAVEKFYSATEAGLLLGFSAEFIRNLAATEELVLREPETGEVISQPVFIGKQLRVPASALNAYLARHPYQRPALGVKARRVGELR